MGKRLIVREADFSSVRVSNDPLLLPVFNEVNWGSPTNNFTNGAGKCLYGKTIKGYNYSLAAGLTIVAIKVDVRQVNTGVFQFGVVRNMSSIGVVGGSVSYDPSTAVDLQTLTVSRTGVQVIELLQPVLMGSGDWAGVGNINLTTNIAIFNHYKHTNTSGQTGIMYACGPYEAAPDTNKLVDQPTYSDAVGLELLYRYE